MRRILFLLIMGLSAIAGNAQEKMLKFFEDGKYWICEEVNPLTSHKRYFKIIVDRTVTFNGHEAKVLIRETIGKGPERCEFAVGYEENGCIYVSWCIEEFANKMIDFNVMPGEVISKLDEVGEPLGEYYDLIVEDFDFINIDGCERKIIKLTTDYNCPIYWIEDIGANMSFGHITEVPFALGGPEEDVEEYYFWNFNRVIACYKDAKCLFTNEILQQYESGNKDLSSINQSLPYNKQTDSESIFDLMGRKVTHPQPGHIYITPSGKRVY